MRSLIGKIFLLAILAASAWSMWRIWSSPDPAYTMQSWAGMGRFTRHDADIRAVAAKHGVDPLLVKALAWRESRFSPEKAGTSGERGMLQVGEAAARDWAAARKVETFMPTDLYDARTNLDAGVWYLRQALDRWKGHDDPRVFALAEYNAGRTRADRWLAATGVGERASARQFLDAMDFPSTRQYVGDVLARRDFYERHE